VLGIVPKYEVANLEGVAAVERVISANVHRRHDDPSVRAMQVVNLREMLKVANLPSPTLKAAAERYGVSYKTARNAQRVHQQDSKLAEQVQKGKVTVNLAIEIMEKVGQERDKLREKVAAAKNKKDAKAIVGQNKAREKKKMQSEQFGALNMPDLTGKFSTLLKVLENIPKLSSELRNLKNAPHQLSANGASELKKAVEGLKSTDFEDLVAAADVALFALDRIIARANVGTKEEQPAETGNTADAVADAQSEAV
jgi:hypothetical protein